MKSDTELLLLATQALVVVTKHRELHETLATRCHNARASMGAFMEGAKAMALNEVLRDFQPFIVAIRERASHE